MKEYNFNEIEQKWQKKWEDAADTWEGKDLSEKPKWYTLFEFPYPSGDGLHMGHLRGQTLSDVLSRKKRMDGYNVMLPIGWDAFGLPTENYAIKHKIHPAEATRKNITNFKRQIKSLGYLCDWSREINTTDPGYYKWTQWLFLQFYKNNLAYKKKMPINWCPSCKIGLANEEVVDSKCERCGTPVEKREISQWMLKITAYADKLIEGLQDVDFSDQVKTMQKNWIGKSVGSNIKFKIKDNDEVIEVFTTRADTLFGCTYVVVAPESEYMKKLLPKVENKKEVQEYIKKAAEKSDLERQEETKEKTGVRLNGVKAINPINNEEVEVWVADYVLASYGTGAVMAVPAHDDRDFEFAKKYNIAIKEVIIPERIDKRNPPVEGKEKIERKNVQAVVKNTKTGKFLCLHSKKHNWNTLPMGGVDDGEDIIEAAKREVREETGYVNLINGKILGGEVRAEYFANHKDQNRVSFTNLVYFELGGEEHVELSPEEEGVNEILWIDAKDLNTSFMVHAEMDIWLDRLNYPEHAFTGYGVLVNSGEFSGLTSEEGKKKITEKLKETNAGDFAVNYKLRDWIFSRQHYWGEPIPIINCEKCGMVPVPDKDLPVVLPDVKNYEPTDTGESPLAAITDWVSTTCPVCGGPGKRETDTMPNWAGSSWYFLRYIDPHNAKEFGAMDKLKYWMPVDIYDGGPEHITLHLLYSRFWNEFFYDLGLVPVSEPFKKRIIHGIVLAPDGKKMSKSLGNVINPDTIVGKFGADAARTFTLFMGPYDQMIAWDERGFSGVSRFLAKVWENMQKPDGEAKQEILEATHKTIKGVTEDLDNLRFNTAVAKLMELNNLFSKEEKIAKEFKNFFVKLLNPIAPHMAEELNEMLGNTESLVLAKWPKYDEELVVDEKIMLPVQVNGKIRGEIEVPRDVTEEEVVALAKGNAQVVKWLEGKEIRKTIYKAGQILNFVI